MRAGELLGRTAYDLHGRRLGRVVDVVVRGAVPDGRLRLTDVVVAGRWYARVSGRLIGAERHPSGPWLIRLVARALSGSSRQVPADAVRLVPPVPGFPFGAAQPGQPHPGQPPPSEGPPAQPEGPAGPEGPEGPG
ncbi:PRC-barrel domain containing protein [Micromonospora sp. NPDC002575]|uniref:PRC-barrel domain containing protein n=1 Tax=Micromonospora sp. NPDC002575 TaxID=3364222 RepID=UPI0036BDE79B